MNVQKTGVRFYGEPGLGCSTDTIEHQGMLWLVPAWIKKPLQGLKRPERLICLTALKHHAHDKSEPFPGCDYILQGSMPRSVWIGQTQGSGEDAFLVVEAPDLWIPIPTS
jgi:hypothetical protein